MLVREADVSSSLTAGDKAAQLPVFRVAEPAELAVMLCEEALVVAHDKLGLTRGDPTVWPQRPDFFDYFVHALASAIARTLAGSDPDVQAVYLHDSSLNADSESGEAAPESEIARLLVHVTKPSAGLSIFGAELDRALTARLKDLPSPRFKALTFAIDVTLITDEDLYYGRGHARLLAAVFSPPLPIWRQDA